MRLDTGLTDAWRTWTWLARCLAVALAGTALVHTGGWLQRFLVSRAELGDLLVPGHGHAVLMCVMLALVPPHATAQLRPVRVMGACLFGIQAALGWAGLAASGLGAWEAWDQTLVRVAWPLLLAAAFAVAPRTWLPVRGG